MNYVVMYVLKTSKINQYLPHSSVVCKCQRATWMDIPGFILFQLLIVWGQEKDRKQNLFQSCKTVASALMLYFLFVWQDPMSVTGGLHCCSSAFPPLLLSNRDMLFVGTFLCHSPGFAVSLSSFLCLLNIVSYFSFAI